MTDFTPVSAVIGGLFIGVSATILLITHGRVAGISGIVRGAITSASNENTWRWLFLGGLLTGALLYQTLWPQTTPFRTDYSPILLLLGGLLVGYGTSLGGGCTSGHGVCGMGRFSIRSIVATLVFMGTGVSTVYVMRHVAGI